MGVDNVWLPPGCKAASPEGNGYDIYDLYDLGEFDQKGQRSTKWGTKEELLELCKVAKENGREVAEFERVVLKYHESGKTRRWRTAVFGASVFDMGLLDAAHCVEVETTDTVLQNTLSMVLWQYRMLRS